MSLGHLYTLDPVTRYLSSAILLPEHNRLVFTTLTVAQFPPTHLVKIVYLVFSHCRNLGPVNYKVKVIDRRTEGVRVELWETKEEEKGRKQQLTLKTHYWRTR